MTWKPPATWTPPARGGHPAVKTGVGQLVLESRTPGDEPGDTAGSGLAAVAGPGRFHRHPARFPLPHRQAGQVLHHRHRPAARVGREDLVPRVLAPDPRPADTDLLHCYSSPWSATPSRGGRWRPARSCWPGSSGNGTDPGRRGASPEGGCRVEFRWAAVGHPKVLPGRLSAVSGDQAQLPGPSTLRCGWRRRACPGRGSCPS